MLNTPRNDLSASITGAINQLPTAIAVGRAYPDIAYTAHTVKELPMVVIHIGPE